jgi:hypothetical protein
MPVTVVQQDWGAALGFDAAALWAAWATDLEHHTTTAGHFMAEETPDEVAKMLRALLARKQSIPADAVPGSPVPPKRLAMPGGRGWSATRWRWSVRRPRPR